MVASMHVRLACRNDRPMHLPKKHFLAAWSMQQIEVQCYRVASKLFETARVLLLHQAMLMSDRAASGVQRVGHFARLRQQALTLAKKSVPCLGQYGNLYPINDLMCPLTTHPMLLRVYHPLNAPAAVHPT